MYIYILRTRLITNEIDEGWIYSPKPLDIDELIKLLIKSAKVIGDNEALETEALCRQANKILGTNPVMKNINEIVEIWYYYADECNCGEYKWLEDVIKPDYISKLFYNWYDAYLNTSGTMECYEKRKYTRAKIGLNFTR